MNNRFVSSDGDCRWIPCTVHDPTVSVLYNVRANKQLSNKMLKHSTEYMNNFVEVNRTTHSLSDQMIAKCHPCSWQLCAMCLLINTAV